MKVISLGKIVACGACGETHIIRADGSLSQVQSKRSSETYRNFANGFIYNPAGAVTAMRLGNGNWENTVFNSRLQPTQIGLGNGVNSRNLLKLEYAYGATASANNGNVTEQTITGPGVARDFARNGIRQPRSVPPAPNVVVERGPVDLFTNGLATVIFKPPLPQ